MLYKDVTYAFQPRPLCPPRTLSVPGTPAPGPTHPASNFFSFVFIFLQIPFPASPFFSHPYKTPGVWGPRVFLAAHHTTLSLCFHSLAASLISLCALFPLPILYFQQLAASFAKTPGWGGTPAHPRRDSFTPSHALRGASTLVASFDCPYFLSPRRCVPPQQLFAPADSIHPCASQALQLSTVGFPSTMLKSSRYRYDHP